MKKMILFIAVAAVAVMAMGHQLTKVADNRDYEFEQYCDSIWDANPDYYLDVLSETDEYCSYVETHGVWWEE